MKEVLKSIFDEVIILAYSLGHCIICIADLRQGLVQTQHNMEKGPVCGPHSFFTHRSLRS